MLFTRNLCCFLDFVVFCLLEVYVYQRPVVVYVRPVVYARPVVYVRPVVVYARHVIVYHIPMCAVGDMAHRLAVKVGYVPFIHVCVVYYISAFPRCLCWSANAVLYAVPLICICFVIVVWFK